MKSIYFQTSPHDEWLVISEGDENIIMYRDQNEYYKVDLVYAISAILDPDYPRLPSPATIELLQGTELGDLITQFLEGKLIYLPVRRYEEYQCLDKYDFLDEHPEFEGITIALADGKAKYKERIQWCLFLELMCADLTFPMPDRCWVQVDECNYLEIIEVVNRKPQYKSFSCLAPQGVKFTRILQIVEEKND